jgi:hypothetical protein
MIDHEPHIRADRIATDASRAGSTGTSPGRPPPHAVSLLLPGCGVISPACTGLLPDPRYAGFYSHLYRFCRIVYQHNEMVSARLFATPPPNSHGSHSKTASVAGTAANTKAGRHGNGMAAPSGVIAKLDLRLDLAIHPAKEMDRRVNPAGDAETGSAESTIFAMGGRLC